MIKTMTMAAVVLALCTGGAWAQQEAKDAAKEAKKVSGGTSEAKKGEAKARAAERYEVDFGADGAKCSGAAAAAKKCMSATFEEEAEEAARSGGAAECAEFKKMRHSKIEEVEEALARKIAQEKGMATESEWPELSEKEKALARKLAILYKAEEAVDERAKEAAKAGAGGAEEKRRSCGAKRKIKKAIGAEIAKCGGAAKGGKMKCPKP